MNEDRIQQIMLNFIKDNLTIKTKIENNFGEKNIVTTVYIGEEKITSDTVDISND